MISHEPDNYICPFCNFLAGNYDEFTSKNDIVYQNDFTTAKIAPKWWSGIEGNVIVVPNAHYENIYTIPEFELLEVYKTVKKISIAVRNTYNCSGTSTRQHNELAGNQSVWHLHVHIFPRSEDDRLYQNHDVKGFATEEQRLVYSTKLRDYFKVNQ